MSQSFTVQVLVTKAAGARQMAGAVHRVSVLLHKIETGRIQHKVIACVHAAGSRRGHPGSGSRINCQYWQGYRNW
jgi:hypothetical protein